MLASEILLLSSNSKFKANEKILEKVCVVTYLHITLYNVYNIIDFCVQKVEHVPSLPSLLASNSSLFFFL